MRSITRCRRNETAIRGFTVSHPRSESAAPSFTFPRGPKPVPFKPWISVGVRAEARTLQTPNRTGFDTIELCLNSLLAKRC